MTRVAKTGFLWVPRTLVSITRMECVSAHKSVFRRTKGCSLGTQRNLLETPMISHILLATSVARQSTVLPCGSLATLDPSDVVLTEFITTINQKEKNNRTSIGETWF